MADEMRLTVINVVERRMLYILGEVLGVLLTLRMLNNLWLGLNQDWNLLGMKQVSRTVIRRWGWVPGCR